ncbi:MAG: hypothetical protein C0P64_003815 [Bacillota bacterium]
MRLLFDDLRPHRLKARRNRLNVGFSHAMLTKGAAEQLHDRVEVFVANAQPRCASRMLRPVYLFGPPVAKVRNSVWCRRCLAMSVLAKK